MSRKAPRGRPAPHTGGGPVLRVQETRVFATRLGAAWWEVFTRTHSTTGRLTVVSHSLGGAVIDVECDDEDHARWLADHMQQQGIPKAALLVINRKAA